jgi:hypothetical protein
MKVDTRQSPEFSRTPDVSPQTRRSTPPTDARARPPFQAGLKAPTSGPNRWGADRGERPVLLPDRMMSGRLAETECLPTLTDRFPIADPRRSDGLRSGESAPTSLPDRAELGEDDDAIILPTMTESTEPGSVAMVVGSGNGAPHGLSDIDRAVLDRVVTFAGLARVDGSPQFQIGIGAGALENTSLSIRRLAHRRIAVQVSRIGGRGSLVGDPSLHAMVSALESRGISVVLEFTEHRGR